MTGSPLERIKVAIEYAYKLANDKNLAAGEVFQAVAKIKDVFGAAVEEAERREAELTKTANERKAAKRDLRSAIVAHADEVAESNAYIVALRVALEAARKERDLIRTRLAAVHAQQEAARREAIDHDLIEQRDRALARAAAAERLVEELRQALALERGGGTPLSRAAFIDLNNRAREALNAGAPEPKP